MTVIYRKRQTFFEKDDTEFRVDEDALVLRAPGKPEERFPWRDVDTVRLAFAPTRAKRWRYVFVLYPKRGPKIEIDNTHFVGVANFSDYSETYVPFVRAALDRIRAEAPEAKARIGSESFSYYASLAFFIACYLLLGFVLVTIPSPLDYMPYSGFVKLGIVIFFLPVFFSWVKKARPRGIQLDQIPRDALPRLADA
jgi:hypothetical protein